jgi:hypothetical protein
VEARAWVVSPQVALSALNDLRGRPQPRDEFTLAAQLECALAEVAHYLSPADGRPVLVTAGSRPPNPPHADVRAPYVIPCPHKRDWRHAAQLLAALPHATFGAFTDRAARDLSPVWGHLGRHAIGSVTGTGMAAFAAALGLAGEAPPIPFPLVVEA